MNFIRQQFLTIAMAAAIATISLATGTNSVEANPPQSTTEFTIEAKLNSGNIYSPTGNWYSWGKFQATGAIQDNGRAFVAYDVDLGMTVMELTGKDGDMNIALWTDENRERYFTIIEATGEYTGLVGITGSANVYAEVKRNGDIIDYWTLFGSIVP